MSHHPPDAAAPDGEPASGRPQQAKGRQRVAVYGICQDVCDGVPRVLLVRAASSLTVAGNWFLPGGGIDHGEDPVSALRRECREETGLDVVVGDLLGVLSDVFTLPDGSDLHTIRIVHAIDHHRGELRHEPHGSSDLARWVPVDEALDLPLMPYVRRALTELR